MIKLKTFCLFFLLFLFSFNTFASHYMGGEITWVCVGTQYKFKMKAYRECAGCVGCYMTTETINVINYPNLGNTSFTIPVNLISQTDISPVCNNAYPQITCATTTVPNTGGVEEFIWESAPITLSGVPPAAGWIFAWGSCCRNPCANITNTSSDNWVLRCVMYPYNGQNANPCFDNSPTFAEKPSTIITTGYPFTYNHNAWDVEMDSLTYAWDTPLDGAPTAFYPIAGWNAGYSYNSPLPGTLYNPLNVPATVNPQTGEISFLSYTSGAFITVIKVTEWRCHIKIGEIFREMQIVLLPGVPNTPPDVPAPFPNPTTGVYDTYIDTVEAGTLVCFPISATDFSTLPNGNPQTMTITASGSEFGTGYTSTTTGCLNPPCATLNPPPPISGPYGVSTNFCWQTTCAHVTTNISNVNCQVFSNIYNFVIKVTDDYCPAPAIAVKTFTIVVKTTPILDPPSFRCVAVQPNGDVTLSWVPPVNLANSFNSYHLYSSNSPSGPFTEIDSIFNWATTSYTHVGANAQTHSVYYYLKTRSGCAGLFYSHCSDTLKTILLDVTNPNTGNVNLSWNPIHNPPLTTSLGMYYIYREHPLGTWVLIDSTTNTNYTSNVIFPCDSFRYRVEIGDSSGCFSVSSIDFDNFRDTLDAPDLRCVAVDASGNVNVTWIPPPDPLNIFNAYLIYSASNSGGPYTLIDSVFNLTTTTYTHNGAGANTAPKFYYIKSRTNCYGYQYSDPSDTLKTIFLTVTNTGTGTANLAWNPIHTPPLPTSTGWYKVYREFPAGTWILLDSTQALTYVDTITVCNQFINYRVEIADASGCISVSSIAGDLFQDITAPPIPTLDSVSVNNGTHHAELGWVQSSAGDTQGYIIYQNIGGIWSPIDTVYGINNTFYEYLLSNPDSHYESYCIAAFDSCQNTSPMGIIQNTIHLTAIVDICGGKTNLAWNPYINMPDGVAGYNIYSSENGAAYTLDGTVSSSAQSYAHTGLHEFTNYCYYVQAYNTTGTIVSTSNDTCIYVNAPAQPNMAYVKVATVDYNDHIQVRALIDTTAFVAYCKIYRAELSTATYVQIGTVPYTHAANIYFNDYTADFNARSYYYKVVVVDSCGNDAVTSNVGRTIYLTADAKSDMTNELNWNDYEDWLGNVNSYSIYRRIDDVPDLAPLAVLPAGTTSYLDDVSDYTATQGKFVYYVKALEGPGNPYMIADSSFSNEAYALQPPKLFVPNAFTPGGKNPVFIPYGVFIDVSDYLFSIYNRWGTLLFQTNDPNTGWDGTFKGDKAENDVYVYYIRYKNSRNKYINKSGSITLIR
jgi:gliding motility-associated-like protein